MRFATTSAEALVASTNATLTRGTTGDDGKIKAQTILHAATIAIIDVTTERTNARAEAWFARARTNAEAIGTRVRHGHRIARHAELGARGLGAINTNTGLKIAITTHGAFGVIAARGHTDVTRFQAGTSNVFTPLALECIKRVVEVHKIGVAKRTAQHATTFRCIGWLEADVCNSRTIATGLAGHRAIAIGRSALENGILACRGRTDGFSGAVGGRWTICIGGALRTKPVALVVTHGHARR
jgi:hypothetical protein